MNWQTVMSESVLVGVGHRYENDSFNINRLSVNVAAWNYKHPMSQNYPLQGYIFVGKETERFIEPARGQLNWKIIVSLIVG